MRRLLVLVGAIVFVDTMFFAALTPLLPDYADRYDLSKAGAGILSAAYPAGALVGGIPSGLATARFGPRSTAATGLLLMTGTTITFGVADNIWLLDAARFAQGFASALAWTAALAWLVSEAPAERRGELIGTAMAAAIVGALFGPVLGGLASVAGTELAFGLVGVATLVLAVFARARPAPAASGRQPLGVILRGLRDRRMAGGIWFVTLPALLFGTLAVLAPLRLSELGLGAVAIGAAWLLAAGLEAAISPLLGRLSDRRGRLLPIRAALVASATLTALLPWPDHRFVLAALVVAGGVGFGMFWTPAMSMLADVSEQRGLDYGFTFALINLAWAPGQVLGASGSGALAQATSDAVPYLLLTAACVLTLLLLWRSTSSS